MLVADGNEVRAGRGIPEREGIVFQKTSVRRPVGEVLGRDEAGTDEAEIGVSFSPNARIPGRTLDGFPSELLLV